jgi:hypothetical protein
MSETAKILVDLDSLFDLRQATLYKLSNDKEKLTDYLVSEDYNFRTYDDFSLVDMNEYQASYDARTIELLPYATITYILNVIKTKISNLEKRNNYYNEKKGSEVIVNVYPLQFNKTQIEQIQNLLFVKFDRKTLVTIVSLSHKEITPLFIVSNCVTACFMYDFKAWMSEHVKILETGKLTDCLFYFPGIGKNKPTKEEEQCIKKLGFKDVFSYTEFLLSSVMSISFLPTVFYSNIITSISYLDKFNDTLMKRDMGKEVPDVDISKFDIPS